MTARELSLKEIGEIRKRIPADMEIETFVHGAMCISYAGRCLLSAYLTAVFEMILHGYEKEKMEYCMDTLNRFFLPGWMAIMG